MIDHVGRPLPTSPRQGTTNPDETASPCVCGCPQHHGRCSCGHCDEYLADQPDITEGAEWPTGSATRDCYGYESVMATRGDIPL